MTKKIYYFTGTGNSMRAATKIAERLGHTEIISMRTDPSTVPATDCDVIGFVYPVYHWTMPDAAVKFIEQLDINPNAYIFVIAMPSFIVGEACERLEKILEHKKAKLSYGEKVNSVANYMLVYPPIPFPKLTVPKTEKKLKNNRRRYCKQMYTGYSTRKHIHKAQKRKSNVPIQGFTKICRLSFHHF